MGKTLAVQYDFFVLSLKVNVSQFVFTFFLPLVFQDK